MNNRKNKIKSKQNNIIMRFRNNSNYFKSKWKR